jgi:transcriptional regulator with XRE-family HTH domain/Zn-dependent peptidase ImmA (M78 family)
MMRVDVKPNLILWACERARRSIDSLAQQQSFRKLSAWVSGEASPTLRQLEHFAKATHTPLGYFFLPQPPKESVPIPDLRTIGNEHIGYPSPDLLDTMYICQQRQEWYQDFARSMGEIPLPFVGSFTLQSDVVEVSRSISKALGFDVEERRSMPTWTEALRRFISQADSVGIMVMVSGIVGSNTHRSLDPQEFRGFALADPLAPLVFINGKDTKAAQMFTDIYRGDVPLREELDHLARWFKVNTLVILRRLHDAGKLSSEELWRAYEQELKRLQSLSRKSGGNFYLTLPARVSKRFARALVISTLEGQTLHRDAFRLLGFSKLGNAKSHS